MIDTHCHLTFDQLASRLDAVIHDAAAAGVDRLITVGTDPADGQGALAIAEQHPAVFAAAGVHPHYADQFTDADALASALRPLMQHDRTVAFGEMGLDYHYPEPSAEAQQRVFGWQLDLACRTFDKPIVIHNREATDDTLAMIRESGLPGKRFVFHCFTGSAGELDAILDSGAMVSLTGIVTFKNSSDLAAASDRIPLDRLMVETDSPYLTPAPHRKVRPNEPKYVVDTARFLAERRGMTFEAFTAAMDANAQRFFQLPQ